MRFPVHLALILTLVLGATPLLLSGCTFDDGWYTGEHGGYQSGDDDLFEDDDDTTGDDDDTGGDDDDTGGGDDDTGGDDDDTGTDDDDTGGDDDTGDDDDDTGGDDDDTGGDDDDTLPDDDDSSPDDDDTLPDDDDTLPDDDDATPAGGALELTIEAGEDEVYPPLNPGQSYAVTITLTNVGGDLITGTTTLPTSDPAGTWLIDGGEPAFLLSPGTSTTRDLVFTPPTSGSFAVDWTATHTGTGNASPQVLSFTGQTTGGGETNCSDGVDNDLDLLIDCDDSDCSGDPNCNTTADFCCSGGDATVWAYCWDTAAGSCVCTNDPYCCNTGWDATCVDLYIINCNATTCGP